ncbi:MAG: tRNA (uridine(34)/cytosine(34)/5-carboxymethylaminomethyluridine(34)-2'-O)-methyltransferase TrmL [Desulfotomaculales bacterium]
MHVVLVEPEIPANTGNIARTCAATGTVLHLVRPLGFSTDDKHLKRAGLDYWHLVEIKYHNSFAEVEKTYKGHIFYFFSTRGKYYYTEIRYPQDAFLVFGRETRGLPRELLEANAEKCIRIPMIDQARSLNLANAVAVVLYEALRQNGFQGLK